MSSTYDIPLHQQMVEITLRRKERGVTDEEIRKDAAGWIVTPEAREAILRDAKVAEGCAVCHGPMDGPKAWAGCCSERCRYIAEIRRRT